MTKCHVCNQEFATVDDFDAHDCVLLWEASHIPEKHNTFEDNAAYYGWRLPVIAFGVAFLGGILAGMLETGGKMAAKISPLLPKLLGIGAIAAIVVGFALSVVAVRGAFFKGMRRIAKPALAGIIFNGAILAAIGITYFRRLMEPPRIHFTEPSQPAVPILRAEFSQEAKDEAAQLVAGGNRAKFQGGSVAIPANWKKFPNANGDETWAERLPSDATISFDRAEMRYGDELAGTVSETEDKLKKKGFQILSEATLITDTGMLLIKVVLRKGNSTTHMSGYFLESPKGTLLSITCIWRNGADMDAVFDACVSTFKLE